jgi:dihydroxy-acid dehydratase
MAGHVAPEAAVGGPIALLREGDEVTFDVERRRLDVALSAAELARRRAAWRAPAPRYAHGVMAKYAQLVSSASEGAVTGTWLAARSSRRRRRSHATVSVH